MLKNLILTSALTATALAQSAIIVVETSHGGAGNDVTNTTIEVPLGAVYTNESVLNAVSFLFLVDSTGVAKGSITCMDYVSKDGTGTGGRSFNLTHPGLLSTNTVQVGSIVCNSTAPETGPLQPPSSSSSASSASVTWYMPIPINTSSTASAISMTQWSSGNYGPTSGETSSPTSSIVHESPTTWFTETTGSHGIFGTSVPVVTTYVSATTPAPSTVTTTLAQSSPEQSASPTTAASHSTGAPGLQNAAIKSELAYGGLAAAVMGFAFML